MQWVTPGRENTPYRAPPAKNGSGGPGGRAPRSAEGALERTPAELPPDSKPRRHPLRDQAIRLRQGLRSITAGRPSKCGRIAIAGVVELRATEHSAHFHGVMTCGSVWACPACSIKIRAQRAAELAHVVGWHGIDRTLMATFTIRHSLGDSLILTRRGMARAWQSVQRGAAWQRQMERVGLVGFVRSLEVTHGENGWHPHLHVLLLTKALSSEELAALKTWLSQRWAVAIQKAIGDQFVPNDQNGCDLRACNRADYLSKIGLELTFPHTKLATGTNLTPLQLAQAAVAGDLHAAALWRQYADDFKGARMLTWSHRLRANAGLKLEPTDSEVAWSQAHDMPTLVVTIARDVWRAIRERPETLTLLLNAAESHNVDEVARLLIAPVA